MFDNIPAELRARPQWVLWRNEARGSGTTKVPYQPSGFMASANDFRTWSTWEGVFQAYMVGGYDGVGYVLSLDDPYSMVDLDDPYAKKPDGSLKFPNPQEVAAGHALIIQAFTGTYMEVSPSGAGLHIVALGFVPDGHHKGAVGIFHSERYMTFTGNVFDASPITEKQEALDWLVGTFGSNVGTSDFAGDFEDKMTDEELFQRAAGAVNGEKFQTLWNGDWSAYPSQSEGDFALMDILAFYSQSRMQLQRMFQLSGLGQRDKAKRVAYIYYMINKSFDRQIQPLDLSGVMGQFQPGQNETPSFVPTLGEPGVAPRQSGHAQVVGDTPEADPDYRPDLAGVNPLAQDNLPGLVGQLAQFFYHSAHRPVPEIANATALALMAGICGRAWNVNGQGLNLYLMLLAGTGRGKEHITTGIDMVMGEVERMGGGGVPGAKEFHGIGRISSGQALVKYLDKTSKSIISVQGEIDLTLKNMTAKNASGALIALKQTLLDLFMKSGRSGTIQSTIYSDAAKDTARIVRPALSIIGEGTPSRFYDLLDESLIQDGLLPRFIIVEYLGIRVPENEQRIHAPWPALTQALAGLCGLSLHYNASNLIVDCRWEPEAERASKDFGREVDALMNAAHDDTIENLWNRAQLNANRLAAILAVGVNPQMPTIDYYMMKWAIDVVKHSQQALVRKFERHDVGTGDAKAVADLRRKLLTWFSYKPGKVTRSHLVGDLAFSQGVISLAYMVRSTANISSFRDHRLGATTFLKTVVQSLCEQGVMQEVDRATKDKLQLGTAKYYVVQDSGWLGK